MKVNKETNIAKLIEEHPETVGVFLEYGLHCAGCMAATFDSIEQGAQAHGMDEETIENLVEDLNLVVDDLAEAPEEATEDQRS